MNAIIDTHTHLESFHRKGLLNNALEAAANASVSRMITVGTDSDDWDLYAELAASFPGVIDYTIGMHPCSVDKDWEGRLPRLASYWESNRPPVALGEIGLDRFHLPKDPQEADAILRRQKEAFRRQLELANELGAVVVVHSRGAFDECVDEIDKSGADWSRVVFHCFSEGPESMAKLVERGGIGSFTGIITFKNAHEIREAAKLQGLGRLMIETDAPYLAPMPHRGKPNEPAYLRHTAEFCADLFGIGCDALADATTDNAKRLFRLDS